ncbi:hypothetical protein GGI07_002695 [Coemansia sp. Benny D115]|nr:hypothetical protein GGI07_002695 [Coemansia sp. Benny D115]
MPHAAALLARPHAHLRALLRPSARRTLATQPAAHPKVLCFVSRCTDPYANLAFEDWVLRTSDPTAHVLYLWRNQPTIVIGRNQNPWKECNLALMRQRGVLLARRSSGGGAVYHDMGNTNYTVVMPRTAFSRDRCAEMVARALQHSDIPAYVNARHDIAVDGRKVSGSAYKLTSSRAFHHGTMLIDADLDRLNGCLRSPAAAEITALGVDSVRSTVVNLRDHSLAIDHQTFCSAVAREFLRTFAPDMPPLLMPVHQWTDPDPRTDAERRRLQTWDWLYAQTPQFTHSFNGPHAAVALTVYHAHIKHAAVTPSTTATTPPAVRRALAQLPDALASVRYHPDDIARALLPLRALGSDADALCAWLLERVSRSAGSGD